MKKINILIILIFIIPINIVAQRNDSLKTNKSQVTFAFPIGSNGVDALRNSNNFSFNILYGLNGGVKGVEIGSILNYNKGNVKGFQLSGVSNINSGYSEGLLLSGVTNICSDSSSGLFISGVLNYAIQNSKGLQIAPVNFAENELKGFQIGVFNSGKKIKGIQIGIVNYLNDGEKALPIGLFSIVKNGYFDLEFTGGEAIYANLNYKMGVKKFYTLYKLGFSTYKNNPVYSFGLGFGSNISLSEKQIISIDYSINQIIFNNKFDSNLNLLNKFDFNYKYNVSKVISLLIGPSFNIYLTKEIVDGEYGTLKIPYSIYSNQGLNNKLFIWIGINAGLSFKI